MDRQMMVNVLPFLFLILSPINSFQICSLFFLLPLLALLFVDSDPSTSLSYSVSSSSTSFCTEKDISARKKKKEKKVDDIEHFPSTRFSSETQYASRSFIIDNAIVSLIKHNSNEYCFSFLFFFVQFIGLT